MTAHVRKPEVQARLVLAEVQRACRQLADQWSPGGAARRGTPLPELASDPGAWVALGTAVEGLQRDLGAVAELAGQRARALVPPD